MDPKNIRFAQFLTYAGTLPLILSAIAITFGLPGLDFIRAAVAYGAVIVSFLCGIHWAVYLFFSKSCPQNLLFTSNLTALTAWVSLLAGKSSIALLVQSFCFAFLLWLDRKLFHKGILPGWFYALRRNATAMVIVSLSLIAYSA